MIRSSLALAGEGDRSPEASGGGGPPWNGGCAAAPSTMLRMVPLPRCAREELL